MWARVISGLIGVFMLYSALGWIIDPASAAAGLAMALVEGPGETTLGMNTQIGDFTSFFFTAGIMACIGAYRNEHVWLYGTISLLGSAAVFRTYAGLVHGADFLTTAIVFEVVMSLLLFLSVYKIKSDS
jgi:hypothetical protein|tara:strand:- start:445 stop:831 length:387 start_codon:yes stop_codon:yes gene_type:complete